MLDACRAQLTTELAAFKALILRHLTHTALALQADAGQLRASGRAACPPTALVRHSESCAAQAPCSSASCT